MSKPILSKDLFSILTSDEERITSLEKSRNANNIWANVKHFGATGDGSTNDFQAFQDAYDSGLPIYVPTGTYYINSWITGSDPLVMFGDGPGKTIIKHEGAVAVISGSKDSADNLTANASGGQTSISVASSSGYTVSDYLLISSSANWTTEVAQRKGEIIRIKTIDSATSIVIDGRLVDSYNTADTAKIEKLNLVENSYVKDITFENVDPSGNSGGTLQFISYNIGTKIENCEFIKSVGASIALMYAINFSIENCTFTDGSQDTSIAFGYGVGVYNASQGGKVHNCTCIGGELLFTTSGSRTADLPGIPRDILVSDCITMFTTKQGFHTHEDGEFIHFQNCQVFGVGLELIDGSHTVPFMIFGKNCSIKDCKAINILTTSVWVGASAQNTVIDGITLTNCGTSGGLGVSYGIAVVGANTIVRNCNLRNCHTAGILIKYDGSSYFGSNARVSDCYIHGNELYYGVEIDDTIDTARVERTTGESCTEIIHYTNPTSPTPKTNGIFSIFSTTRINNSAGEYDGQMGAFYAWNTGVDAHANGTKVICNTENFDTSNWYDTTLGRFTPQIKGYYFFSAGIKKQTALSATDKYWTSALVLNGVTIYYLGNTIMGTASAPISTVSGLIPFNGSTDYVEIFVYHNEAGSVNVDESNFNTYFTGHFVGASN